MYRKVGQINWVAFRIALVAVLFAAGTVLLMLRAYSLQVSEAADSLRRRAEKQRTRVLHLEARRGMVLDRRGDHMAASLEVDSIYARPRKIKNKQETARSLAELLEMDENEVLRKLDDNKAFVWIMRRVSPLVAEKIKQANLEGVLSAKEYKRFYPLKSTAAHTIGFAGMDSRGLEGLELFYDADLKAEPVPVTAQRDALGRPVMFDAIARDPKRRDLHLTLDRNIQYVAERALDEAIRREQAKSGVIVVMDADSGEVLAIAVRPTYNLNVFHKASPEVRRNRAVSDTFEPGSTFKVFLAAAAIELGKVTPQEKFYCHNGLFNYKGAEIHDIVPYKELGFDETIIHSSNIGAVKVSEKLAKGEFYRILQGFGFGAPTEVDLPGERGGMLQVPGKWSVLAKGNIAFGQGLTVNPLQLTAAFAAAINGGILYRPHLMKRIATPLGETTRENPPVMVRRVIKQSTSERLVEILKQVVQQGTGRQAAIPDVEIVGKTGTAQKADPAGGYSKDKYVTSFIGAVMGIKPRPVILVIIDEPAAKHATGGKNAAPVFRKVAEGVLALCGSRPTDAGPIIQASADVHRNKVQAAHKGLKVRKGPNPGEWVVPDLKGMDMRQVLEVCGTIKCDASFNGVGHAVTQDPAPGSVLKEGATLAVVFGGNS